MDRDPEFHHGPAHRREQVRLSEPRNDTEFHAMKQAGLHPIRKYEEPGVWAQVRGPTDFPPLFVAQKINFLPLLGPGLPQEAFGEDLTGGVAMVGLVVSGLEHE